MSGPLTVALGEYDTGWHDPARSLARADRLVRTAASCGARLVVLPEMCTTGFTMDPAQAEPADGPSVCALGRMAAESRVHVVAGLAVRECVAGSERVVNMALHIDADGEVRATYRKQRLFAYAGEGAVYTPGSVPEVIDVEGVRLALFVCYDLRFPELSRRVAREVDAMIIVANWPASRRAHWDALLPARAIENQCCVVAVNRRGIGGGVAYDGGSVAFDAWGARLPAGAGDVSIVEVDPAAVRAVRAEYPFLKDYQG